MKIICFVGPKQSGKDTTFDLLKKNSIVKDKLSFAAPLKELCAKHFNLPLRLMHDPDLKEKPLKDPIIIKGKTLRRIKWNMIEILDPFVEGQFYNINKAPIQGIEGLVVDTPRKLLQIIGTDFIRDRVYSDWHVKAAFSDSYLKLKKGFTKNATYAVTDCRFANEYQFLKDKYGKDVTFVYVERPVAEEQLKKATHQSELEVNKLRELLEKDGGIVLKNNGTLNELEKTLLMIFSNKGKEDGKSKRTRKTKK